jgi:intein-encoded DNA endonuclease-like protein
LEKYFENHEGSTTLAKKYGVNPTTIQKWLSHKNRQQEVRALIKLKNWDILKAREEVQEKAAELKSLKLKKKVKLRFDESFAYVLGVICGDGYVSEYSVRLECQDINFAKNFLKKGKQAFGIQASFSGKRKKAGLYRVVFYSRDLANSLRSFYKTRCKDWEIPKKIMQGSEGLRIGFLKGFVDSEGHVSLSLTKTSYVIKSGKNRHCLSLQGYVNLSSTNEKGIKQVASLLKNLGIRVHLYPVRRGGEWRISTVKIKLNLLLFQKLIDFRTIRDIERLKFLISNIHYSPKKWRWSGPLHYLPKRCLELIKQEKPQGIVFLDRRNMPQK